MITGASSGIGKEFAKALSTGEYHLILVARREERLIALKDQLGCECTIITSDLSQREQCYDLYDKVKDFNIELLINNAGFGDCGFFVEGDLEKELDMLNVNVKALHILTKLILKQMYHRNSGYILNVASSAGLFPGGPYMASYYATKAYVTSFTQAIAKELKDMNSSVYIGCLCPGPVHTEFNYVANVEFSLKGISAAECVRYCLKMMKKKKIVIIPSLIMKLAVVLGKISPRSLCIAVAAHQQKKKFYRK
jgi:Short-chain dehydrogenases of various substrate specificities